MDTTRIVSELQKINNSKWENCLEIGSFKKISVDSIITRPYSYNAKCVVEGEKGVQHVYAKFYRKHLKVKEEQLPQNVQRDFETLNFWYNKFKDSEEFSVIRPLMMLPERRLLITEESTGRTLFEILNDEAAYFPSIDAINRLKGYTYNAGVWVRRLQSFTPGLNDEYSIEGLRDYIDKRLIILTTEKKRLFSQKYRDKILGFFDAEAKKIKADELKLTYSHSDFNPGNIIVNKDKITAIDFGEIETDSHIKDISRFYHQLYLWTFKPKFRLAVFSQLQQALLEGFGRPKADQAALFRLFLIRHSLTHLITITRFWLKPVKERIYNYWVLNRELSFIRRIINTKNG